MLNYAYFFLQTEKAVSRVGYTPIAEQIMTRSLFGGEKTGTTHHKKYLVHLSSLNDNYSCHFSALDQKIICEGIPSIKTGLWCEELEELNINFTDIDSRKQFQCLLVPISEVNC